MIRILHVLGGLDRGGAETMVMNLYRAIDRSQIQFDFITHTDRHQAYTDEILKLGGKIYYFPKFKGINFLQVKKLWTKFFKEHPEYKILHSHVRSYASLYLPIAKKAGLKTIIHSHSTSNGKGLSSFVKRLMQFPLRYQADYFFGCSKEAGEWLFGKKVVESSKYHILRNAIDTEKFIYSAELRNRMRKELNLENKLIIGNIGRLTYPKNQSFLIEVFEEVCKKNCDTVLVIVGKGSLEKKLREKVSFLGLENNVVFLGERSDIPAIMFAMDVFVFPSIYEGLGIVAVESQAAGLRTICSDRIPKETEITDLIEYISLKESKEKWSESILNALHVKDRPNKQNEIVCAGYDIKKTADYLACFYESLNEGFC